RREPQPASSSGKLLQYRARLRFGTARTQRLREVPTGRGILRIRRQGGAQQSLGFRRIAAEQARQLEQKCALCGERVAGMRRELERSVDLAVQPAEREDAHHTRATGLQALAQIAEHAEVRSRILIANSHRVLGELETARQDAFSFGSGKTVGLLA